MAERLGNSVDRLDELLAASIQQDGGPHRFVDQLLQCELTWREERRVRTSLKLSGLPTGQTLATCQWIRENRTVLLQGPPGVGKTHLAASLGVKACEHGAVDHRRDGL